jgi:hypothetical protein
VVIGILQLGGGKADTLVAAGTSTTTFAPSTTATQVSTTTAASTTTTSSTSTTTATTVAIPSPTVADFVDEFRTAIDAGHVDFLFDRLHPVVLATYEADLCRGYIEREILALDDYRLIGPVEGPFVRTFPSQGGEITVEQAFDAPVSFNFQGQSFDVTGGFAIEDGQVYWFTECR